MMTIMPIEISREGDGWKVWFGTLTTDRSKLFATAEEADAFAQAKFANCKRNNPPAPNSSSWASRATVSASISASRMALGAWLTSIIMARRRWGYGASYDVDTVFMRQGTGAPWSYG